MAFTHSPKIVQDGLVFYVDPANPRSYVSGSLDTFDLNNLSPTGTGSLKNGIDVNYSEANGVWDLDGADDYIEWLNITSANPISFYGQNEFTGYYWAKPEASGDTFQRIIDKSNSSNGLNGWCLIVGGNPAGTHEIYFIINNTHVLKYTGTDGYTYGEWNQITITKNGSTNKFYLNGGLMYTSTVSKDFPSTTTKMNIGSWPYSDTREFNGEIGPIILYNKELTANEVLHNYNALKGRFGL